jgi:hypothetical protein
MIAGDPADWDDFFQQSLIPAVLSLVISAWDRMEKPEQTAHEDDISFNSNNSPLLLIVTVTSFDCISPEFKGIGNFTCVY